MKKVTLRSLITDKICKLKSLKKCQKEGIVTATPKFFSFTWNHHHYISPEMISMFGKVVKYNGYSILNNFGDRTKYIYLKSPIDDSIWTFPIECIEY